MVETYTEEIGGIKFRFSAEEVLRPLAEPLLEAIEQIPVEKLKDGFRIEAGFTTFTLSDHNGGYDIAVPDYTDDPFTVLTTDLTMALLIQFKQVAFLKKQGVMGQTIHYYDKVAVAKGALESDTISMHRYDDLGASGWSVELYEVDENGKASPVESQEYEAVYAYELLTKRPALVDALLLPFGYIVVYYGDEVVACFK